MAQVKEEQLKAAREVKSKQQQIQMELGALYVSEKDIADRQATLVAELRSSGDEIKSIIAELEKDYGAGSLNLETGEFTSEEEAKLEIAE